jgi:hypothetical protein
MQRTASSVYAEKLTLKWPLPALLLPPQAAAAAAATTQ